MRASEGSSKRRNFSKRSIRKKQSKYLIGTILAGSYPMTLTVWPRIPRRFLATQFPKTLCVICSTADPAKSHHFYFSSHRPHASNSFASRNRKKSHFASEKFDRTGLSHNTVLC